MAGYAELNVRDQQLIVNALLDLGVIATRVDRDVIVDLLGRKLGHKLTFSRHAEDNIDVWSLVDACLRHPGALWELVALLRQWHEGSFPMLRLEHLVARHLPEPLLEP